MKRKKNIKYFGKGQVKRLIDQHEKSKGVKGIFSDRAKSHDTSIRKAAVTVLDSLEKQYGNLDFRHRTSISKKEINSKLNSFDTRLGKILFVESSNIKPDGGIIEVKHKKNWRIVLISECKHQGNDIEKIKAGIKQGKNKDQDLMTAGNAIERVHKNILEVRNIMMYENHFPYVVFLQGANFATKTYFIKTPAGRKVKIAHNIGSLNRIDRVTPSNYGMDINKNHCRNIKVKNRYLQAASLYCQCHPWTFKDMFKIMYEIAETSLKILNLPFNKSI